MIGSLGTIAFLYLRVKWSGHTDSTRNLELPYPSALTRCRSRIRGRPRPFQPVPARISPSQPVSTRPRPKFIMSYESKVSTKYIRKYVSVRYRTARKNTALSGFTPLLRCGEEFSVIRLVSKSSSTETVSAESTNNNVSFL